MAPVQNLVHQCKLIENRAITKDWYRLKIYAPAVAGHAEPGQFVHLRAGMSSDPLLRRPFSIHYADAGRKEIWLLIRVAGTVTAGLAGLQPGRYLDLLGPLGNGFPAQDEAAKTILVAGGIGLAPIYFLARRRKSAALPFVLILGALTKTALPGDRFFSAVGLKPQLATDDGSRGYRGSAADLLDRRLRSGKMPARIHACGPVGMLSRVVELGRNYGLPTHISLESHLACAVGACLGCAFPFKVNGVIEYRRVCRDGPVFDGEEAFFERA